jgi:hypothetical protein
MISAYIVLMAITMTVEAVSIVFMLTKKVFSGSHMFSYVAILLLHILIQILIIARIAQVVMW